jgi:uncharacterized PurR-regulated membrane protein YhhQ (DUF165 family)
MIWLVVYVASMVVVNLLFGWVPFVGSIVVGGIFLARDAAQDYSPRLTLAATFAGIGLSYAMANQGVAIASAAAFAVGELSDFGACYALRHRTLRERMIITQPLSVFLDTTVFMVGLMYGIGLVWSWSMFSVQVVSKFAALGVLLIVWRVRR